MAPDKQVLPLVVVGVAAGAAVIWGFERYRVPVSTWVLSDPQQFAWRLRLVALGLPAVLLLPLLAFAVYFWVLGRRVLAAREFPPRGARIIGDAVVIIGPAAVRRGRVMQWLSIALAGAAVGLWLVFWWMVESLAGRAV